MDNRHAYEEVKELMLKGQSPHKERKITHYSFEL
jgi:hypothetical protein